MNKRAATILLNVVWMLLSAGIAQMHAQIATPQFSPPGGTFTAQQFVAINCSTPGVSIHYTTNNVDPQSTDPILDNG